jgi:hypothetical protein
MIVLQSLQHKILTQQGIKRGQGQGRWPYIAYLRSTPDWKVASKAEEHFTEAVKRRGELRE